MATVQTASAHRWVPSVLLLSTLAACGGSKPYGPTSPQVAYSGGGGAPGAVATDSPGYGPSAPPPGSSHGSIERQAIGNDFTPAPTPERPGLGTTWGEQVSAPISFSPFIRSSSNPWAEVALHYNDAQGVAAHAAYLGTAPQPLQV